MPMLSRRVKTAALGPRPRELDKPKTQLGPSFCRLIFHAAIRQRPPHVWDRRVRRLREVREKPNDVGDERPN